MNVRCKFKHVVTTVSLLLASVHLSAQNGVSSLPANLSSSYSYVLSRTMTNASGTASLDHVDYDNGLGQTYQKVDVGMAKSGGDLVSLMEYDGHGRPLRSWLPGLGSGGACINASTLKQSAVTVNNDEAPYTWTVYEKSPLDRLSEEYQPGNDWHQHGKKREYTYNRRADGVKEITIEGSSLYFNGTPRYTTFYPVEVRDEAGTYHIEYRDADGRTAAKSDQPSSSDLTHVTYYVYDDAGKLRFVLPPEAYYQICTSYGSSTATISPTHDALLKYGYEYRYDGRGNCIYKRLPGCDPVYYIYDKSGRCIFSQDGVQRNQGKWQYTIPDVFGRTTITGICTNSLSYTAEPLKATVVTASRTSSGGTYGYAISGVSLSSSTVYTVIYYDNYSFIGANGVPSQLSYAAPPSGYDARGLTAPKGLATGSITARMTSSGVSGYDYSAVYYDDRGRTVQTRSTNHMGGYEYEYIKNRFASGVDKRQHVHSASGQTTQTETYTYTYDNAERLLTTKYKLNSNSEITLHQNTYDNLGRLIQKTNGGSSSMTEAYTYNVRSWLKTVSIGTLFSETLYYNDTYGGSTAQYTGNISAMTWKADSKTRGYKFTYDGHSRLKKADYMENGSASGHYDTEYTYDRMGNFLTLKRKGRQDGGTYGWIDNLTFTLNGNQITKVDDSVSDPTYSGVFNFMDGASQANEYTYDKNGNLTKDLNKKISQIQYNLLNLPASITYSNGKSAAYIYDAGGKKLKVSYKASSSGTAVPTDYCGSMIYENNVLKQILVDGGYVTFSGSTPVYHYYLKDHLGNNRVVCSASGTVEQINHYYPFGGLFGESTSGDTQRFKYNGKELDRMHGLDWYDYGARHMDGMRFTTIDPLAEKDYPTSPYAYCSNNPIIRVDKDGRIWDTVLDVAFTAYDIAEAGYQYATQGKVDATTKAALAADALAIVVPGVTGAGLAVRAGEKAASKAIRVSHGLKNARAIAEGKAFEKAELAVTKASGEKVASQVRLVPNNGKGNVKGNRSNVDQLIKKTDGNFKVIETKLREGTSKLSTGQDVIRKHVQNGNQKFEVRSDNKVLGLNRGQTIQVDEYVVKYKYKQ
ncbi:MAG: RHS repeat-associated core domain-containing protein [Prevotella ruminicola]|uniref:RHS repeat-associated core domain-containing protein n=1 Tax=Xylanibacter ruminicola TaxID=839 RepID=A0A928GIC3_XYLRU|nr:RHS repeat-associated core domain-containing protein [Xylanibacter ruminicola]